MNKKKKSKNELSNEKRHPIHSELGKLLLKLPTYDELHKKTLNERLGGYGHMVFMSKDAEKQFNDADVDVKVSILNQVIESANIACHKNTMESLVACVNELQSRVLDLESKQSKKEKSECCQNKSERVHLMMHALLPILNSDDTHVGDTAMTMLILSKAQDDKISKESFMKYINLQWDKIEGIDSNNSNEDKDI